MERVLADFIEQEKQGRLYCCSEHDRLILGRMFEEINRKLGTDIHYLAQADNMNLHASGEIMREYIELFESEYVRAYLIPQLVYDKVKNCADTVIGMYMHFKASDYYIAKAGQPMPAAICVRYDNAFRQLKPKKMHNRLLELAHCPVDVFYLPFTMRMLASWKSEEMENILISYLKPVFLTAAEFGLESDERGKLRFEKICRELMFTALGGLKYYPSAKNIDLLRDYVVHDDADIRAAAKKSIEYMQKHRPRENN